MLTILGLDGSVGNDHNGPLELVLEVLDNLGSNLLEVVERSEGDSDDDVLAHLSGSVLELNLFGRVEVHELQMLLKVLGAGLKGDEGLSDFLFEFGGSLLKQGCTVRLDFQVKDLLTSFFFWSLLLLNIFRVLSLLFNNKL